MARYFIFLFGLLLLFAGCNKRHGNSAVKHRAKQDTLTPPHVTMLADLPDSLQPTTRAMDTAGDEAGHSAVSEIILKPPLKKLLPVLENENGDVISDTAGQPFIMGNGGISNFTNFTTDNGLALDAVKCSILDKMGNLWFGTQGGGASRYDGKSFTTFSVAQGLANNNVRCILEDKKGNLWFGTYGGGASCYDGKSFTTFSTAQGLANNSVLSIAEDKTGNIWFGTQGGGVSRYDPSASLTTGPSAPLSKGSKAFTTFSTSQGLANNIVLSIAADRAGKLWFGTYGGGVSCYDPSAPLKTGSKAFTTFSTSQGLANNVVTCIAEDSKGTLWFGTQGGGVSRYDPSAQLRTGPSALLSTGSKAFSTFSTAQGLANAVVRSMAIDEAGNMWFGTQGGGLSRYDGNCGAQTSTNNKDNVDVCKSFTTFSVAQGLANNTVNSITEDKTGKIWLGTGGGVSRYEGSSFTLFSTAQGLANYTISSIAEDNTGNLWFGTYGGGVSCYDGKSFTTFSTTQGLANNSVFSIAKDKSGNLWFGTQGGGVSRYGPSASLGTGSKSFTTFSTAQGLANNFVLCIAEDRTGNLWFGTQGGGVSRYGPSAPLRTVPSAPLTTGPKSFTTFSTAQGLANNVVAAIAEDKTGNLWFSTWGGGVSRYDGKSITTFSAAQGLANNSVISIAVDDTGNIWFGTEEGLSMMSADIARTFRPGINPNSTPIFRSFTKKNGLPDNVITQVLQMPDGKMAAGTNLGIAVFMPSKDLTALNNIEIYNSSTGYPVKDVNAGQHCMLLDRKGIVWAGIGNEKTALVRFDPSSVFINKNKPVLIIKSIRVNDENICWYDLLADAQNDNDSQLPAGAKGGVSTPANVIEEVASLGRVLTDTERDSMKQRYGGIVFDSIGRFYPIPGHLVLPYHQNHITIDFNAIETGKPSQVNYRYMLEGYSKGWSPAAKETRATFGNMGAGIYTFKVKAQGPDGEWGEPITYRFEVLPAWYSTWWAYGIYALLFMMTLRLFINWRERSLRNEKAELEIKVKERTVELMHKNIVVEKQKEELILKNLVAEQERQRSEELLLNILPEEVATELKLKGTTSARQFDNVTVLFTDFVNFTSVSERMSPQELIEELNQCFRKFDEITERHKIEKIKTIGDAYLAVAGMPTANTRHAENTINAAIEILAFMQNRMAKLGDKTFEIRIGVNSGSVVAGIIGIKKFAYDIWGDTVNTAARMEQNCQSGRINISQATYDLVKDNIKCTYRGEISAKGKGMLKMYYVG